MLKLVIENLEASYGSVKALHGVSMSVNEGEIVALLGTNGNGKSTLLKCIMGVLKPTAGSILLQTDGGNFTLHDRSPHAIVELGIAIVPEGRRLFPRLTVEQNLRLGAFTRAARGSSASVLEYCYGLFPILKERRRQLAGQLSGGQQQMIALSRALMSSPQLLLVDEPSLGLAPIIFTQLLATILELRDSRGLTVLMAEQNFHQSVRIANRGYVMVHGQMAFSSTAVDDLAANPLVNKYYLGATV